LRFRETGIEIENEIDAPIGQDPVRRARGFQSPKSVHPALEHRRSDERRYGSHRSRISTVFFDCRVTFVLALARIQPFEGSPRPIFAGSFP
jgi:hypothetical protein